MKMMRFTSGLKLAIYRAFAAPAEAALGFLHFKLGVKVFARASEAGDPISSPQRELWVRY